MNTYLVHDVFVGPPGSGKSTALRSDLSPWDRGIALVFQSDALYPHMSVQDNLAYGSKLRRFPKPEIGEILEHKPKARSLECSASVLPWAGRSSVSRKPF